MWCVGSRSHSRHAVAKGSRERTTCELVLPTLEVPASLKQTHASQNVTWRCKTATVNFCLLKHLVSGILPWCSHLVSLFLYSDSLPLGAVLYFSTHSLRIASWLFLCCVTVRIPTQGMWRWMCSTSHAWLWLQSLAIAADRTQR